MRRYWLPLGLAAMVFSSPLACTAAAAAVQAADVARAGGDERAPLPRVDEGSGPLTLERALELAQAHSYPVSAALHEVQANEGLVRQAAARRNPELEATVEDTRQDTRTSALVLAFPLELGGKREARVAHAELGRELALAELEDARAEVRAEVISAFFAVLVAQERVELAGSSVALARRGADAASRRVAAGKISPVDETRSRVAQANAELELADAQAALRSARETLAATWGSTQPAFSEAIGDVDALPDRGSIDALVAQADASPRLLASRLQLDQRHAAIDVERSRQQPDLVLSLGTKRDNDLGRTQAVVGLSVTLPWFDANVGNLHAATQRASKAADEHRAARLRLVTALRRSAGRLATTTASARALRDTVLPAARQAHEAATRGFEAGKFGLLDVLDTQRTLLQARVRYLETVGDAWQAAAAIDRLLGR